MSNELVIVRAPGHRKCEVFLPCPVLRGRPEEAAELDGAARTLTLTLRVDPSGFTSGAGPDPGSRVWLLARALEQPDDASRSGSGGAAEGGAAEEEGASEAPDDDAWAEDAFHAQDFLSQHYLAQKKDSAAERRAKAKREREERTKDPNLNIEYIDDVEAWAKEQNVERRAKAGADGTIDVQGTTMKIDAGKVGEAARRIEEHRRAKAEEEAEARRAAAARAALPCPVPRREGDVLAGTHGLVFDLLD
jgi:hypothetical protein